MRRTTVVLTGMAALVAAMLGRMGWVSWIPAIHAALCISLAVSAALVFIAIGAAVFIGMPVLLLVGVGRFVVWLFRPVNFGDTA